MSNVRSHLPLIVNIEPADPQGQPALELLAEAAAEARARSPELFPLGCSEPSNAPTPAGGIYLLAWESRRPVASGAFGPIDKNTAEVRRIFVTASRRRRGLASAVLAALEKHALQLGYSHLLLETGDRQSPAVALYAKHNFRRIPAYGSHAKDPTSICFGKALAERET